MFLMCIASISASQDNATLSVDNDDGQAIQKDIELLSEKEFASDTLAADENGTEESSNSNSTAETNDTNATSNTTVPTPQKVNKKTVNAFCSNAFIQKSNKYFTVKLFTYNEKTNKLTYYKNVKITVKVKIGSTTKTYNVKTNSKGEAKILNVKNLKAGLYTLSVASNDDRYTIKEKGYIGIFNKKQYSLPLKMNTRKKIRGDYLEAFYLNKNSVYPKGAYVDEYNAKNPQNKPSKLFIMKAKFFFKNKKTGKIISKTVKTKADKVYGWVYPYHKLIKGYIPLKATVWYVKY